VGPGGELVLVLSLRKRLIEYKRDRENVYVCTEPVHLGSTQTCRGGSCWTYSTVRIL
jgi:hypothetical protein